MQAAHSFIDIVLAYEFFCPLSCLEALMKQSIAWPRFLRCR